MKRFVQLAGLTIAITSLNACANSGLEEAFKPDPQLENNPPFGQVTVNKTDPSFVQLPENFPSQIPLYPNATLQDITASEKESEVDVITHWKTADPMNSVENFYLEKFQEENWQIVERPNNEGDGVFVVRRENLQVTLGVKPDPISSLETHIEIRYIKDNNIAKNTDKSLSTIPLPPPPPPIGTEDLPTPEPTDSPSPTASPSPSPTPLPGLDTVPQELREFVSDVSKLGVLQASPGLTQDPANSDLMITNPNSTITRGEFARWLVNANNNFFRNSPAKQIRPGVSSSEPIFTDVPTSHPYFPEIQGLAGAGLIPSSLSGESSAVSFRPDAPLTREDLILWKVPLDTRQALPRATVDAVQERWGFQDAAKIETNALRAVLADFDNGDNANIRRVFGFTTLFQPKKTVTRAEAASALWYFGFQGDGISAQDVLQAQRPTQNRESSSN